MSGYAGIVRIGEGERQKAEDALCVGKMARAITFRGPDAQMVWERPGVHFCFSFLKTGPAPQIGKQPCSLDGQVWLLGDVRLDGREELIRQLEQQGEKVEITAADEALILHTFHAFGEDGIAKLDGDFSFVLWDERSKKLSGFRDLTGAKPLFYSVSDGALSISNTMEALRASPGFDEALDENFLGDYLVASWCPEPERTVYRQIRRLPPGYLLEFSGDGLRIRCVAQLPIEDLLVYKQEDEYIEHYRDLLHRAVKDRLPHEMSVVFMSGGLDSAAVAAEANRISVNPGARSGVRAQTIDYRPLFDDQEGEEARRVAEYLKIPFELLHGGGCEPFSGWDVAGFPMPEPRHEPFQTLHVERHSKAAANARVALSGDGGDDVLLGQGWPYLRYLLSKGKWISAFGAVGRHIWNNGTLPVLGLGIRSRIQNRFGGRNEPEPFPEWIAEDFEKRLNLRERFEELQLKPASEHPTHPWAYAMLKGPFWPSVLEGEDAAWSGVALETRAPLLDTRMIRYLLRLPAFPWCMNKHLVRRAMKDALPKETLERPKTPLAQDPLALQVEQRKWTPAAPREFSGLLQEIVDVRRLGNCLQRSSRDALYANLRPVSFERWLKSVEMKRGIQ
ncbi:MAG TPA: asparagine synthase-related protein [Candidatus Dormibacteraeota bacterium]|jgi:asparagine synthase (glutamine-hydrolysing)|nr:asparagine synthase-related protein [Candidatus Dormibacteraeota bacterium]